MRSTISRQQWIYNAPPTIANFIASNSFGRLLCGPVGSGKTTGCIVETARRMGQQSPSPADGRQYTRFAVIRQTLKDAKATVLKDIRGWFGAFADWRVSESTLYIELGDIYSEWVFIPLDEPEDVKRLLSLQLTAAYINECSETDINLLSDIAGRVGRYPNNEFGACTWSGIYADTNMPIIHTPWADFIQSPPNEWEVFRQPGGHTYPTFDEATGEMISMGAENLPWLTQTTETLLLAEDDPVRILQGRNYYNRLLSVGSADYIRRYVWAEFGRDPSGLAVFAESFQYDVHIATPTSSPIPYIDGLQPVYSRMLIVGQDFGRNPWSLICQLDHAGRLLVLEEVPGRGPSGDNIGLQQHIKQNLAPVLMSERYRGRPIVAVGDPSGVAKDSLFEINAFDLCKQMGLHAEPAPTNDIEPRIRAVEALFMRRNGIIIDGARCPTLVAGLQGQYKYKKKDDPSGGVYEKDIPEKLHPWSDVCDDLQYVALITSSMGAYQWLLGRVISRMRKPYRRPVPSAMAWT